MWLDKAILEAPYLRDPYIERALLEYELNNFKEVKKYCLQALKIKSHLKTYINEPFSWNYTPYDLLSISEFYLENYDEALKWCNKAIDMEPNNERLLNNKKIIQEKRNST